MSPSFKPGDWVIYRKPKFSLRPGPHARDVYPTPRGDYYSYRVDKYWTVVAVEADQLIVVCTRRGKQLTLTLDDPALRPAPVGGSASCSGIVFRHHCLLHDGGHALMGVWDWINEFNAQAEERCDRNRVRLRQLYESASNYDRSNPDVMLGLLAEGRALAQQLDQPWWVLFFDHWRLQALMHFKYDYRAVRDLAIQATLEARKPQYAQLPQRLCLHEDLIFAYVGTDPEGHAEQIQQALDYMRQEVSTDLECRFCVQNCRSEFAMQRGKLDEAEAASLQLLAMTDAEKTVTRPSITPWKLTATCVPSPLLGAIGRPCASGPPWARKRPGTGQTPGAGRVPGLEGAAGSGTVIRNGPNACIARLPPVWLVSRPCPAKAISRPCVPITSKSATWRARWASAVRNCKPSPARDGSLTRRGVQCCRLLAKLEQPLEAKLAAARDVAGGLRFFRRKSSTSSTDRQRHIGVPEGRQMCLAFRAILLLFLRMVVTDKLQEYNAFFDYANEAQ